MLALTSIHISVNNQFALTAALQTYCISGPFWDIPRQLYFTVCRPHRSFEQFVARAYLSQFLTVALDLANAYIGGHRLCPSFVEGVEQTEQERI